MRRSCMVLVLLFLVAGYQYLSAQLSPEKINSKRYSLGKMNDSAWGYSGFWSRHYFMGEKQLSYPQFLDGLAEGDEEVAVMIRQYRMQRTLCYVFYIPGLVAFTAGSLANLGALFTADTHKGETLALAGAAAMLAGGIFIVTANSKFKKAVNLFNYKTRRKELSPGKVYFRLGPQRNGLGISFNW